MLFQPSRRMGILLLGIALTASYTARAAQESALQAAKTGDAVDHPAATAKALSAARFEASRAVREGDATMGASIALEALRKVDSDNSQIATDSLETLSMLEFICSALMRHDELTAFISEEFRSRTNPMDKLAHLFIFRAIDLNDHFRVADRTPIERPSKESMLDTARELGRSPNQLVRLLALYALADPAWRRDKDTVIAAMNDLAQAFPQHELAREMMRLILSRCKSDPIALEAVLTLPEWNDTAKAILRDDPVSQLVRQGLDAYNSQGYAAAEAVYLDRAANAPDPRERFWALCFACERRTAGEIKNLKEREMLKQFCEGILAKAQDNPSTPLEKAMRDGIESGRHGLDVLRVHEILFSLYLFGGQHRDSGPVGKQILAADPSSLRLDANAYVRQANVVEEYKNFAEQDAIGRDLMPLVTQYVNTFYPNTLIADWSRRVTQETP